MSTETEPLHASAIELQFSSTEESKADKLGDKDVIWKDILCEGKFSITPGRKKKVPFQVIPEGSSDAANGIISMSDLIKGYDEKAFEDVTIPDGHPKGDDSALNNTGYVNGLRVVKKKGKHFLQAALGFTEPDVAAKVRRGSVPNVSSGVFFNFTRKADDRKFPCVLNHVALTKTPWIPDLDPFKRVFASDDNLDGDFEIIGASFADGDEEDDKKDVIWNEKDGSNWVRESLSRSLAPEPPTVDDGRPFQPRPDYYVEDVSQSRGLALVTEWFKGDRSQYVVPFTVDGDEVKPAPMLRWTEGKQALIAASDDSQGDKIEFEDVSADAISDKLTVKLSDMEGSQKFKVESVSLDNRCRLRNTETGQGYEAPFRVLMSGDVFLFDASEWERTDKVDVTQPASTPPDQEKKIEASDVFDLSTPDGRVAAARMRRRSLVGVNTR